jgi:predicted lipid-binding transport protein (Tim44 family)
MIRLLRGASYRSAVAATTIALALSACSQTTGSNQTQDAMMGALAGGLLGGVIGGNSGNQVVGALAGAAIGGLVGAGIGSYLDEQDREQLAAMTQATAATGSTRHYYNRSSRVRLTTRPAAATSDAADCHTIDQEIVLADGTAKTGSVRACRAGGGWTYG